MCQVPAEKLSRGSGRLGQRKRDESMPQLKIPRSTSQAVAGIGPRIMSWRLPEASVDKICEMILIRLQGSKAFVFHLMCQILNTCKGSPIKAIPPASLCTEDARVITVHLSLQIASAFAPAHAANASNCAPARPSRCVNANKKCNRKTKSDASGHAHETPSNLLMYRAACPELL
jgi:hypothetical protein